MKRKLLLIFTLAVSSLLCFAEPQPISVRFQVRADWEYQLSGIDSVKDDSGFSGKYLNFLLDGNINEHFSYHFRYRLNKVNGASDFFEATDWAYLDYDINKNWRVSAGKQVVAFGGIEYDKAPIDVYFWSNYWNNVICYEFGVSGQYTTNDGKSTILAQVCNSPFTSKSYRFDGLYAYNLMWYGRYGAFRSIYSVNMVEYAPSRYINYIFLGNHFNFGPVTLEVDYMNRYGGKGGFFNDISAVGSVIYNIKDRANVFVKGGYDRNMAQAADTPLDQIMDLTVLPGTEYGFYGAGAEFFPIKNSKDLKMHAFWASNNNNFKAHQFSLGFTWTLNAFKR